MQICKEYTIQICLKEKQGFRVDTVTKMQSNLYIYFKDAHRQAFLRPLSNNTENINQRLKFYKCNQSETKETQCKVFNFELNPMHFFFQFSAQSKANFPNFSSIQCKVINFQLNSMQSYQLSAQSNAKFSIFSSIQSNFFSIFSLIQCQIFKFSAQFNAKFSTFSSIQCKVLVQSIFEQS